jgi:hypothetical protein
MSAKVLFDVVWFAGFVLSFSLPVAVYRDFSIYITSISYDFHYFGSHNTHFDLPLSEFRDQYCRGQAASSSLCTNLEIYKAAGILYLILGALSFICFLYTTLQVVFPHRRWDYHKIAVYGLPLTYAAAVLCFFAVIVAFLRHQSSLPGETVATVSLGVWAMLGAEVFAVAGAAYAIQCPNPSELQIRLIGN